MNRGKCQTCVVLGGRKMPNDRGIWSFGLLIRLINKKLTNSTPQFNIKNFFSAPNFQNKVLSFKLNLLELDFAVACQVINGPFSSASTLSKFSGKSSSFLPPSPRQIRQLVKLMTTLALSLSVGGPGIENELFRENLPT